ncbi:MAG: hypothetical protein LDL11_08385 [Desulfarculus sp.]|nr:hypothetical protein [Desulfarculus sp.]
MSDHHHDHHQGHGSPGGCGCQGGGDCANCPGRRADQKPSPSAVPVADTPRPAGR